jgi:hypothetical protein
METLLVTLKVLEAGQPFDLHKIVRTYNILWIWKVKYTSLETYEEHILRLTEETLAQREKYSF